MNRSASLAFAQWLKVNHPDIFNSIAQRTLPVKRSGVGDITDFFSSVGDTISNAASSAGDFISNAAGTVGGAIGDAASGVASFVENPANVAALSKAASSYFGAQQAGANAQAQTAVLQTQLLRAQSNLPPAPISYATNSAGQVVPVYTSTAGYATPMLGQPITLANGSTGYGVTPASLAAAQPTFIQRYGIWLAVGGGVLLLAMALKN